MNEKEMQTFIDSKGKAIRRTYRRGLELFSEFYGKSVKEILEERKNDVTAKPNESLVDAKFRADRFEKELEKYHTWLQQEKHYSLNTARAYCNGLIQLFNYFSMPINIRRGSPISQTVVSLGDFVLKPIHVRKMFHIAKDLRSKLIISLANDLGWRVGDFVHIKIKDLPNLEQESPIEFSKITQKKKVVSKTCLSRDTVELLKEYIWSFGLKDDSFVFWSNGSHIAESTVNSRLRDLARESDIDLHGKSLTFHCFRKMLLSEGKNVGVDPDILKLMVGKSVSKAMLTYMTGINVRKAFMKLQESTHINGAVLSKKKEEAFEVLKKDMKKTKEAMFGLEKENSTLKTRIDLLQTNTTELNDVVKTLTKYVLEELKAELPAKLRQTTGFEIKASETEKKLRHFLGSHYKPKEE